MCDAYSLAYPFLPLLFSPRAPAALLAPFCCTSASRVFAVYLQPLRSTPPLFFPFLFGPHDLPHIPHCRLPRTTHEVSITKRVVI
ncbi:hypothetical protein BJV78DRAFT_1206099, partial [Lactifluus subvellereus]